MIKVGNLKLTYIGMDHSEHGFSRHVDNLKCFKQNNETMGIKT
jgi:hypothetical protein